MHKGKERKKRKNGINLMLVLVISVPGLLAGWIMQFAGCGSRFLAFFSSITGNFSGRLNVRYEALQNIIVILWVFTTTVIVFYAGYKANPFYGVSNWKIVLKSKAGGVQLLASVCIPLFGEALSLAMTAAFQASFALTVTGGVTFISSIATFGFAMLSTDPEYVRDCLFRRAEKSTPEADELLQVIFGNVKPYKQEDIYFSKDLLWHVCRSKDGDPDRWFGRLYRLTKCMTNREQVVSGTTVLRKRVSWSRSKQVKEQSESGLVKIGVLTVEKMLNDGTDAACREQAEYVFWAFAAVVLEWNKAECAGYLSELFSAVRDDSMRRKLWIGCFAYLAFLDKIGGRGYYNALGLELHKNCPFRFKATDVHEAMLLYRMYSENWMWDRKLKTIYAGRGFVCDVGRLKEIVCG